jgi:hypothetical protein
MKTKYSLRFVYKATKYFKPKLWIKSKLYNTKNISLETSFKYESNGILLVTYNSYYVSKIDSQSFTSKSIVDLYNIKTEGLPLFL